MKYKVVIEDFSFGNFRSFKDMQSLNMTAANQKSKDPEIDRNNLIVEEGKTPLLKSKLIYGANASGKSNVVKALSAFLRIIDENLKNEEILDTIQEFSLSTETIDKPTFFQLIFRIGESRYRYGFEATKEKIHSEWLFVTPTKTEVRVFLREGLNITEINKTRLPKAENVLKSDLLTDKTLFISVISSFGEHLAKEITNAVDQIVIIAHDLDNETIQKGYAKLNDNAEKRKTLNLLNFADIGIKDIKALNVNLENEQKTRFFVLTEHPVFDENKEEVHNASFLLDYHESDGTKQLLWYSPILLDALEKGRPIVIDEFGSKLHPALSKKILQLFNSPESNAQLIAVTHSTELMSSDLLRRDQIDFVEKDKYGASHLYSLAEIKGTRNDASFEKGYLQGRYGAIPYLGDFNELLKIRDNGEENKLD